MEFLKIVAFGVVAAIVYGVVHDQVTAHLCVEYFSVAHPPVFGTRDPSLLALGWGVVATWWVGLPLGIGLGIVARLGREPRLTFAMVRRPMFLLLAVMAGCAIVSGCVGAALAAAGVVDPARAYGPAIAASKHVAFAADAFAHVASYASALFGGIIVIGWAALWRVRLSSAAGGNARAA